MPLVVTGRVRHRQLQPHQVQAMLRKHLPGLMVSAPDFSVDQNGCRVEFFCNTSSSLDFTVTLKSSGGPAPAAVAMLAREAQSLNVALLKALGRRFQRAEVRYCLLEDDKSRSSLLNWTWEPPLSSRPAKLSYILCVALLIVAGVLTYFFLKQPAGAARTDNVILLILAICLPALTLPLPFVYEHMKTRGTGRWIYSQNVEGSP